MKEQNEAQIYGLTASIPLIPRFRINDVCEFQFHGDSVVFHHETAGDTLLTGEEAHELAEWILERFP